jgi:hypothetical protein
MDFLLAAEDPFVEGYTSMRFLAELPRVDWGKASQRDGYHRPLVERSSP